MVTSKLESLGYLIVTLVLSLRDHGLKVNRIRVWVLGVLAPFVSEAVRKEAQRQAEIVELYLRQSPLPLSHCLLEESDTDFQYYSKELMAPPNKLSFAEALKGDMKMRRKYPRLHKAFWKKRFKTVAPELPADIDNFYKTTVVTARECAPLQYDERVQEQESQDAMDGTKDSALDNVDSYLDSSQGVGMSEASPHDEGEKAEAGAATAEQVAQAGAATAEQVQEDTNEKGDGDGSGRKVAEGKEQNDEDEKGHGDSSGKALAAEKNRGRRFSSCRRAAQGCRREGNRRGTKQGQGRRARRYNNERQ